MSAFNLGLSPVVETAALTIKLEDGAFSYFDLDAVFNPNLAALKLEEGAEDFEQLEDFLAQADHGDQEIFLGCVELDNDESDGFLEDDVKGAEESKGDEESRLKIKIKWPVLLVLTYQEVEKSSEVDSEKSAKTALVNLSIVSLEPSPDQKFKSPNFKILLNQKLQEVLTKTQEVLITRHEVTSPSFKSAPPMVSTLWKRIDLSTSAVASVKTSAKQKPSLLRDLNFSFIGKARAEREPEPFELMPSLMPRDVVDEPLVGQSDLLTMLSGATFLAAVLALFYEAFQDAERQGGSSSGRREGEDSKKKGLIINLAQAHPHPEGFEYYKDKPEALREVLVSQLQVAEEIMKLIQEALKDLGKKSGTVGLDKGLDIYVFLEGLSETLTPDYPGYLQDKKTTSLLFPDGLPKSADVDSMSKEQQKFLVQYRSTGVLFLLGYLSQLHPTIPKELAEGIIQKIQAGEINDELIDLVVEGRSRMALWLIQEFFGDEFVNAILVFGAGHDLSKYCEDLGYELRRIDCALPEMDVKAPLSREALKAYQKKEGVPTRTIHFDFDNFLKLLGLHGPDDYLEIPREFPEDTQLRRRIRALRERSKLVHFFSESNGYVILRTAAEIEAHFPSEISTELLLAEGIKLLSADSYQLDLALLDLIADKADRWNQYERQCREEERLQKKVRNTLNNEQNNIRSNADLLSFFTDQEGRFISRSSAELRANFPGHDPVLLLLREKRIECDLAGFYKIHSEMLARLSPEELEFNTLRKEIFANYELFENLRNFFKKEGFHGKELGLEQFKAEFPGAPIQAILIPHLIIDEASGVCEIRAESLSVHDSMKADFRRRHAEVFEEPAPAPANGVTKMLSSEDVPGRKDPALLISDPANHNHMDAKEILDFADHVLSECLLNEYRGEQPYKELIQKERLQLDAAREAVRLNPGHSGVLLRLQESSERLNQTLEMHREIAAFQGGTLEHYADEMAALRQEPIKKGVGANLVFARDRGLPAVPNLPARIPEKSMRVLASEVPKGEGLDLHRHQELLEKQKNLYRICVQEMTEIQSKSHFDLPKSQQAEFLERLRENQEFIKDYRANPRNIHEYTLKKLFPQKAPPDLHGIAPFVGEGLGYLVGQGVKSLGGSESLQHGLQTAAAVLGTGVTAMATGSGIPGAVVQAGVVGFVHGAGYAERGEASILGSVPQSDPNRLMANAGVGVANLLGDYFSAPIVAGIALGESIQSAEVSHLAAEIYGPSKSLDEHLKQRSERPDPVPTLTAAVKKVGEHLSKIGEQVLQVEGLEEVYAAPVTGRIQDSPLHEPMGETKSKKGLISRFLDGVGKDLRSFASAPVQQPAPPPQALIIRPTFSPIANFTEHLWAQQQQQSRFVSPIDTWRQQNQFRFEASKSSVSYLSPSNIYGSLSQSSSYSSQPSWFQAPGASFGPSAGSLLNRNSRRPFDQELRNLARAAYEHQGFYRGSFGEAHAKFSSQCRSHGWSGSGDFRDFVNLLRSTGLVASYEASHAAPWSNIPRLGGLSGDIGGVATKVGVIEGLQALLDRGEIKDFNFAVCLKSGHLSFTPVENTQIQYEVAYAALVQETFLFFSLHFNNQANMYPVHHPAFNNLAGRVAALADVMMKGFLNGGVYSEEFLDAWPRDQNSDPEYLKANLIDLKKYCREQGLDFTYKSLRELSIEMGLESLGEQEVSGSYGGMKYMTSFRIIAKQEESFLLDPKTRTFLIRPYFDVEYTIDLMPDYKASLEKYKAEHGQYPEDYEKVKKLYAQMALRIKTQMPKIPLFKKYFELLGLISFYSYLFNTLKKSGFMPKLPSLPESERRKVGIPEIFPHIPVRAYKKIPVEINLAEVFSSLTALELGYLNNFFIKRLEDTAHTLEINFGSNRILSLALEKVINQILLNKVGESLKSEDPEIFEARQKSATQDFKELLMAVCDKHRESIIHNFEMIKTQWALSLVSGFSKILKLSEIFSRVEMAVKAQCTKEIASIKANQRAELAKIPADLLAINQENIRAFKLLQAGFKAKYEQMRDQRLALLTQMRQELRAPTKALNRESLEGSKIKFSYIVSTLDIGNQAYFDACPSHAKVVGGCSVRLPAHDLKLVNLGEDFLRSAEYQGQSYKIFSMGILPEMALSPMDYLKLFPGTSLHDFVSPAGGRLISAGEDLNACLPNGLFPLYIAIQESHVQTALDLIQKGSGKINLNLVLDNGMSALHLAVLLELQEVAEALIKAGADLTLKRKSDGATAFHLAAEHGLTDLCQAMLSRSDHSIDVDQTLESGKTALHLAVQAGYLETVKLLIDNWGANPNLETADQETPILMALKQVHLEIAEFLATKIGGVGANLLAAKLKLWSVADILIARGVSPIQSGEDGRSYIYYLLRHGELQRYQALAKKHRLSPNLEFNGSSSLAIALTHGHLALVYGLEKLGAVYKLGSEIVSPLAGETGPKMKSRDREGAVITASQKFKSLRLKADDLAWLRKYIAEFKPKWSAQEFTKQMKHCLSWAAKYGSKACLREILKQLTPNELGYFPGEGGGRQHILHPFLAAVINGKKSVINLIVQHSPNVLSSRLQEAGEVNYSLTAKRMKYNKAVHIAAQYGHHHLFKYFQEQGVNLYEHQEGSTNWDYENNVYRILLKNNDKAGLEALFEITSIQDWIEHGWHEILKDILEADRVGRSAGYQILKAMPIEKLRQQILATSKKWCDFGRLILSDGLTAACQSGNQEQIDWLLALGAVMKPVPEISLNAPTELGIALATAFKTDDRGVLSQLKLKSYLWIDKDKQGLTIFHHMAMSSNPIKVTAWFGLLMAHISPRGGVLDLYNFINRLGGPSALDLASALHHEWFLKLAYEYSDVKDKSFLDQSSWLHYAVISGSVDLVKFFLDQGVPLSKDTQQKTPLMLAAEMGYLGLVKLLISRGDWVNHQDIFGNTALHYALIGKYLEVALELIIFMSDTALRVKNRLGRSPLMLAAAGDCLPIVKLLNPSDESHRIDRNGNTALHLAANSGATKVMSELVSHGFEVDLVQKRFLFTPLHIAAVAGKYEAFLLLLNLGANVLKKDAFKTSPLERAVSKSTVPQLAQLVCGLELASSLKIKIKIWFAAAIGNNLDVLRELLLLKFPVDLRDKKYGRTALHLAVINKADQAVNLLLQAGIDREAIDSRGNTAMHFAVKYQALLSFRLLRDMGVEIDRQNKRGNTPLHKAVKTGAVFLAQKLLSLGANPETANSQMMTPKRLAKKKSAEISGVFEHA